MWLTLEGIVPLHEKKVNFCGQALETLPYDSLHFPCLALTVRKPRGSLPLTEANALLAEMIGRRYRAPVDRLDKLI
jgi:hypothetical protein